jgi:hypothetical protein
MDTSEYTGEDIAVTDENLYRWLARLPGVFDVLSVFTRDTADENKIDSIRSQAVSYSFHRLKLTEDEIQNALVLNKSSGHHHTCPECGQRWTHLPWEGPVCMEAWGDGDNVTCGDCEPAAQEMRKAAGLS